MSGFLGLAWIDWLMIGGTVGVVAIILSVFGRRR